MGIAISNPKNTIENAISSSVTATMSQEVNNAVNVACFNKQIVDGAKGCDIQFAEQICDAVGISNLTSNQSMDAKITQDTTNTLSSQVAASNEGITMQLAQVSSPSNTVRNQVSLSQNITQSFMTSCTRNVSAINEQSVKNCDGSTIKFAPQMATGKVIGDCVANQVGNVSSAQKLRNTLDLTTTASNKGVDPWVFVLIIAGFFLILVLGLPAFAMGLKSAANAMSSKEKLSAQAAAAQSVTKTRLYGSMFIFIAIIAGMCVWWPGYFAWKFGISPWPYPGVVNVGGTPAECVEGRPLDPELFINKWMWLDPTCSAEHAITYDNPDGTKASSGDKCDPVRKYSKCGLFATEMGCDDPEFLASYDQYLKVHKACGPLLGYVDLIEYCKPADVAAEVFADDTEMYKGCVKCTGSTDEEKALDDPRARFAYWRRAPDIVNSKEWLDKVGAAESQDQINEALKELVGDDYNEQFGSCTAISPTAYWRQPGKDQCDANDTDCYDDKFEFMKASPGECLNPAYQERKRKVAELLQACAKVQKVAKYTEETEGELPPLSMQCPPDAFDYFSKCNRSSKLCNYTPQGANPDPRRIAACKNNLESCCQGEGLDFTCVDPDLEKDRLVLMRQDLACKARWDQYNAMNPWGWVIPLVIYLLGFGAIVYLMLSHQATMSHFMAGLNSPTSHSTWRWSIMIFLLLAILTTGFPFGILGLVYAGSKFSVYKEGITDDLDSFDENAATIGGWASFAISLLGFIVYGMYIIYKWVKGTPSTT